MSARVAVSLGDNSLLRTRTRAGPGVGISYKYKMWNVDESAINGDGIGLVLNQCLQK